MYSIRPTTKFQKDLKRIERRGYRISLLTEVIKKLADGEPLPEKIRTTVYPENLQDAENVISHRTGC